MIILKKCIKIWDQYSVQNVNVGSKKILKLGGGKRSHSTHCHFPCYCNDCSAMFNANLLSNDISCYGCGSQKILPYDDKSMRITVRPIIRYLKTLSVRLIKRRSIKGISHLDAISTHNVFSWNVKPRLGRNLCLTNEDYFCPKCQDFSLGFSLVGLWD